MNDHALMVPTRARWLLAGIALALALGGAWLAAASPRGAPVSRAAGSANPLAALHFRFIGPNGNRDIAVVGVPGDPLIAYFGAASGGIWKTTDGGVHFKPIFDHEDVSSVSSLAVARSDPNIVWAGTGETYNIRQATSMGDGVYKSTDGGSSWRLMGLGMTGHIGNIAIDPRNPDIVFVCAAGLVYRPNSERGVFGTRDGGTTWQQVLRVNDETGCSGLTMDAHDSRTLFAGMWQVEVKPWNEESGGPGSGVFVTHDGGTTWARLSGHGLPPAGASLGKIAVRVAPSDPKRVYALIQEDTARLYRSADGGENWAVANENHRLSERAPYFNNFRVSPDDENLLYFVSVAWSVSRDGGYSLDKRVVPPGGDLHDVWVDPENSNRVMVADDHGGAISLNRGRSWQLVVLPIAQLYHVYADSNIPYNVLGNEQDVNEGKEGPSRVLHLGGILASDWHGFAGCESGFGVPDPVVPDIVWVSCSNGGLARVDLRTGQARPVDVWPVASYGWAPGLVRDRWNWTFPIAISPHNHNQVYVGSQYVYDTTDGGQSWTRISPDLTLNDKSHEGNSGGVAFDNLMTFSAETLSRIVESPLKQGLIWVGSYDGQVNVTLDGGAHWANVTGNIPNLPPWGTINIEPSHFDPASAYVTDNLMMMGNFDPYIYKTTDYGRTWKFISGGIPHSTLSYVHIVREDPVRKGLLLAGTENALYVSWDDGGHWTQLRNNLPPVPVYWLQIQPNFSDLIVGTYGRGIWILDDITPIRSWDAVSAAGRPHLFPVRPAYRFRYTVTQHQNDPNGVTVGENAPYGADFNFYLPAPAEAQIVISDLRGRTIRTLECKGAAALNRVWWDLRHEPPHRPVLLTPPPGEPWVVTPPQGRPLISRAHWGQPLVGPHVSPGTYTVKFLVNGAVDGTEPVKVLADPHTEGTQQSMEEREKFLLQIEGEVNRTVDMINRVERLRKQLDVLQQVIAHHPNAAPALAAARKLEQQAESVEGKLFDVELTGRPEDSFRHGVQLYVRLGVQLNNRYGSGADLGPTSQQTEVNQLLEQQLTAAETTVGDLFRQGVVALNAALKANGFTPAIQQ